MLKRTFYDFIVHFRNHLPHDQGPNGFGVILFLDWHCSRECPQSLLTSFLQWNILIIVLPSKTSIWGQPCDSGKNKLTGKAIAKAAHDQGILSGEALDYLKANKIFREGLEQNCLAQNEEIRRTGSNAVVTSFAKTGIYPMSYDNEGWNNAFSIFGKLNELMKKRRRDDGEQIPEIVWIVKSIPFAQRLPISHSEITLMKTFIEKEGFLVEEGNNTEIPILCMAWAIAEHLLGSYVLNKDQNIDQPPAARNAMEQAALKLIRFVGVTVNDRVDTTCCLTEEEIEADKLRTKLAVLQGGETLVLGLKSHSTRQTKVNVTKQGVNRFLVYNGDRRQSSNLEEKTTAQILSSCCDIGVLTRNQTREDKQKKSRRLRQARKQQNKSMGDEATSIAKVQQKKRNLEMLDDRLNELSPRLLNGLKSLLNEEGVEMEMLHDVFENVLIEPFEATISVTQKDITDLNGKNDITKEFDVTLSGSDTSAVSHRFNSTLLELMTRLKGKNGAKVSRRKRKRGDGQSTHQGKSGVTVGILIQRTNAEARKSVLEGKKKSLNATYGGYEAKSARRILETQFGKRIKERDSSKASGCL